MFCVRWLVANPRKHRVESVMCNRAREDGTGMNNNMNGIGGGSGAAE